MLCDSCVLVFCYIVEKFISATSKLNTLQIDTPPPTTMDHSHHSHHGHHDHMAASSMSAETTTPAPTDLPTAAATVLQTVLTTVMNHHQGHHEDHMVSDDAHVHAQHVAGGHGDGEHNMPMYFYFGVDSVILFKEWTTSNTQSLIFSVIGIIILSMIYEGIKFFREFLFKKYFTSLEYSSVSVLGDDGKPVTEVHKVARNRMFSWPHAVQTFLHVVQMVLSYFLMLIFMTFNGWLCLGVIIGSGIGYFLFGWRKATVVDITEHCH